MISDAGAVKVTTQRECGGSLSELCSLKMQQADEHVVLA